jgi:hypothetical protein
MKVIAEKYHIDPAFFQDEAKKLSRQSFFLK